MPLLERLFAPNSDKKKLSYIGITEHKKGWVYTTSRGFEYLCNEREFTKKHVFRSGRYYVVRDQKREIYYFSKKSMKSVGNLQVFAYKLKLY